MCCGPGNNGGDGLVCARHLFQFGASVSVVYPKPGRHPHYSKLIKQLEVLGIPILTELPRNLVADTTVLVDAIFGFSFAPAGADGLREPFKTLIQKMNASRAKVVAVDIPSGWDVEQGFVPGTVAIEEPEVLVSLTAPKLGVRGFCGAAHYVGGRFVPPSLAERTGLLVSVYKNDEQFTSFKEDR